MTFVRAIYRTLCITVLIAGIAIVSTVWARSTTSSTYLVPPEPVGHAKLDKVGGTLEIDIGDIQIHLDELRFDERPEQIADWAVLGVLSASEFDADTMRAALFDKPQIRFPELEEVFTFDYGRGRRVLLPGRQVWLFYSDTDPAPRATLARLADKVRMETQELPEHFQIFRYRSNLADGVIEVTREANIESPRMFSAEYGYHEAQVSSLADLEEWLERVDDITYIGDGIKKGFTIGGRRAEDHRTANLELEDIAALYQAHVELKARGDEVEKHLRSELAPLSKPFDALVDLYNARVVRLNGRSQYSLDDGDLDPGEASKFVQTANELVWVLRQMLPEEEVSVLPPVDARLNHIDRALAFIEAAEPLVKRAYERRGMELSAAMVTRGELPPDAPGFSLDPQWNVPNLIADLELLMDDPGHLIAMAKEIASQKALHDEAATPVLVWEADTVASMFPHSTRFQVPLAWKKQLGAIIRSVAGKSGREAEEGALVGYYRLLDQLKLAESRRPAEIEARMRIHALLGFIEARNRMQCARYDGPLKGTGVGMNLFYTDLLAKLWAGVDYRRSAPVDQVHGYLSMPRFGSSLGPAFWNESLELPATRLWFGPRQDGYSTTSNQSEIYFTHVSTRVYSAGSNPLNPGEEGIANESSRRVFGWWNRHFENVADHEQQYHVLNQIMKWSMLTEWLLENGNADFLASVSVRTDLRFDRWMNQNADLVFQHQFPFIPEDQWLSDTECIEIVRSYPFPSAGGLHFIEGGVSLGSRDTIARSSRVARSQNYSLRRPGVDYTSTTNGSVRTLGGSTTELGRSATGASRATIRPVENVRMRGDSRFDAKLGNVSVDFVSQNNEIRIATQTDAGSLGRMTARTDGRGVKLSWQGDAVIQDRRAVSRLSELASANKSSAAEIATKQEFAPAKGLYVMEPEHGNPYVLRVHADAADPGAAVKARIYEVGSKVGDHQSSRIDSDAVILTSAGHHEKWDVKFVKGQDVKVRDRSTRSEVKAAVTSAEHADAFLSATPWQRVKLHDEHGHAISRVFSARGPPAGSRRITIETGDSDLPQVVGFAAGDTLYLERPANAAAHRAFNDLVTARGVDRHMLRDISEAAARGDTTYTLRARRVPAMPEEPVQRALDGDYQQLLAELRSAAQRGELDQAVHDIHQLTHQSAVSNLRTGRGITGARHYIAGDYEHLSVDGMMSRALANLKDRVLDQAAQDIHALATQGELNIARAGRLADEVEAAGSTAAADYLRARKGLLPEASFDIPNHLSLQASRQRLRTVLDVDGVKGNGAWAEIDVANRADLAREIRSSGARIYMEPDVYLHGLPWDEAPGPTLARVAADTRYAWDEMGDLPLGTWRSDDILAGGKKYMGIDIPAETVNPRPGMGVTRVIRIRARHASNDNRCDEKQDPCDVNCDGQVSSNEQLRCASR